MSLISSHVPGIDRPSLDHVGFLDYINLDANLNPTVTDMLWLSLPRNGNWIDFEISGRTSSTNVDDAMIIATETVAGQQGNRGAAAIKSAPLTVVKVEFLIITSNNQLKPPLFDPEDVGGDQGFPSNPPDINSMAKSHDPAERVARRSVRANFTPADAFSMIEVSPSNLNQATWEFTQTGGQLGTLPPAPGHCNNLEAAGTTWDFVPDPPAQAGNPVIRGFSLIDFNDQDPVKDGAVAVRLNMPVNPFNNGKLKVYSTVFPGCFAEIVFEVPAVIVIDPGHGIGAPGGTDAQSYSGMLERTSVLDISREIRRG